MLSVPLIDIEPGHFENAVDGAGQDTTDVWGPSGYSTAAGVAAVIDDDDDDDEQIADKAATGERDNESGLSTDVVGAAATDVAVADEDSRPALGVTSRNGTCADSKFTTGIIELNDGSNQDHYMVPDSGIEMPAARCQAAPSSSTAAAGCAEKVRFQLESNTSNTSNNSSNKASERVGIEAQTERILSECRGDGGFQSETVRSELLKVKEFIDQKLRAAATRKARIPVLENVWEDLEDVLHLTIQTAVLDQKIRRHQSSTSSQAEEH